MTIEEIKAGCECGELRKQIAAQKERAEYYEVQLNKLKADYDNMLEINDEINHENANLRGQVKALKFVIKQLAKR